MGGTVALGILLLGAPGNGSAQPTHVVDGERYLVPVDAATSTEAAAASDLASSVPLRPSDTMAIAVQGGFGVALWNGVDRDDQVGPAFLFSVGFDHRWAGVFGLGGDVVLGLGLEDAGPDGGSVIRFASLGLDGGMQLRLPLGQRVRLLGQGGGHVQWAWGDDSVSTPFDDREGAGAGVQGGLGAEFGRETRFGFQTLLLARHTWMGGLDPAMFMLAVKVRAPLLH